MLLRKDSEWGRDGRRKSARQGEEQSQGSRQVVLLLQSLGVPAASPAIRGRSVPCGAVCGVG